MSTPDQEHEERMRERVRERFQWPEPLLQCYFTAVQRNSLSYNGVGIGDLPFYTSAALPGADELPFRRLMALMDPTRGYPKAKITRKSGQPQLDPLIMFDDDRERSSEIEEDHNEHELIASDQTSFQSILNLLREHAPGPATYYQDLWVMMLGAVVVSLKVRLFWWHVEVRDEKHSLNQVNARFRYDDREWTWTLNLDIIKRHQAQVEADTGSHETTSLRLQ